MTTFVIAFRVIPLLFLIGIFFPDYDRTACFGVGRGFLCRCLLLELAVETSHALEQPLNRHSFGVSNPATCVPTLVNQFFLWNPLLLLLLLFFSASNKVSNQLMDFQYNYPTLLTTSQCFCLQQDIAVNLTSADDRHLLLIHLKCMEVGKVHHKKTMVSSNWKQGNSVPCSQARKWFSLCLFVKKIHLFIYCLSN